MLEMLHHVILPDLLLTVRLGAFHSAVPLEDLEVKESCSSAKDENPLLEESSSENRANEKSSGEKRASIHSQKIALDVIKKFRS